jgi:hypothetical protein
MESKKFDLAMNAIKYVIGAIGAIACVWVLTTSPGSDAEVMVKEQYAATPQMNLAIYYTIIIIATAIIGVLLFFVFQLITNAKKTVLSIIGIIAAFILYLVLRMIGTTDTNESLGLVGDYEVSDATLDGTTAGLWVVIIGIMVAILLAILGPFLLGKYRK